MNVVILVGNLTKDPELKRTPNDVAVCQFTLAVNRNFSKEVDFINCVAWRQQAELIAKYLKKGNKLGVNGSIQTRSYDDNNGVKRFVTEVLVSNIEFLTPRSENQSNTQNDYTPNESVSNASKELRQQKNDDPFADLEDNQVSSPDLPF